MTNESPDKNSLNNHFFINPSATHIANRIISDYLTFTIHPLRSGFIVNESRKLSTGSAFLIAHASESSARIKRAVITTQQASFPSTDESYEHKSNNRMTRSLKYALC